MLAAPRPASAAAPVFDTAPVKAALQRLLPRHAAQIDIRALQAAGDERYRISSEGRRIVIAASTPSAALVGAQAYLHEVAGVDIGWPGDSLTRLPRRLPLPAKAIEGRARVGNRFALNDTDDGYSNAYLDWPGWQRKIDLLALHGYNQVFMPVGAEELYRRTFRQFGYTDADMRGWIPAPAHQPWWLLQNMSGFGGPVAASQFARRQALGQRIVARLRELGITPVLPGYFGTVPPRFTDKQPGAHLVAQGGWVGFTRPDWLDPCGAHYPRIAEAFYREQRALFGDSTMYKMDLLHEGGKPGDVKVADAARCVREALHKARPGARWVLLGWQKNPPPALIEGAGREHLFIVDGLADRYDGMDRERDWLGVGYAFGSIPNFGGHTTLGANAGVWLQRFAAWRDKPGSAMSGIAWLPEGSGIDPAAFALFSSLAWEPAPTRARDWFSRYAAYRYGGRDAHAERAWALLAASAYAMPSGKWSEPHDSLFGARPSLQAKTAAAWSPEAVRYADAGVFLRATAELLQVAPSLRESSAYRYDLVDFARQAMSNHARAALPELRAAFQARDARRFRALSRQWLADMQLLDRLLATQPEFLLGNWLAPARQAGGNAEAIARAGYDQRSIITHWGERSGADQGGLRDYANRELAGLVGGLYHARWQRYFQSLEQALAGGGEPEEIDWFAMEQAWSKSGEAFPVEARGDGWAQASEVVKRLWRD